MPKQKSSFIESESSYNDSKALWKIREDPQENNRQDSISIKDKEPLGMISDPILTESMRFNEEDLEVKTVKKTSKKKQEEQPVYSPDYDCINI